jgi:ABC-2 type transport system ATP-binding protein
VTERCWLRDVINRPIGQLSKGYRQRVGLADTLLHNPRVLILDEPTVGLDPTQVRETRTLLRELAAEHAILFSSHTLSEVEAICHRILILHEGKLIASGTVDELKARIGEQRRIFVELKAAQHDALAGVQKLPGVTNVSAVAANGWTRLEIAGQGAALDALAALACEKGWAVRELRREAPTFEDFFVKAIVDARAGRRTTA